MRVLFAGLFAIFIVIVFAFLFSVSGGESSCGDNFYCAPGLPVTDSTGITIEAPSGW